MDVESVSGDLTTPAARLRQTRQGRAELVATGRTTPEAVQKYATRRRVTADKRQFIAWDGEGVTVRGRHRYVILANSVGDSIVNRDGILAEQAFNLLLSTAQRYPHAVHVIFAGGYDANMILRSVLTRAGAHVLSDHGSVTVRIADNRYRITYHPRHTFEIRHEIWDETNHRIRKLRSMTLWDVFGSFQASFVVACKRTLPDEDLPELGHIQDMKAQRGSFRMADIPDMLAYCQAELRALVKLVEWDAKGFEAAGFHASRWDGAGAKASAVLRQVGVGDHKTPTPEALDLPTKAAYAGGRIETVRFGRHDGDLFTVDIRSAYPWAATMLPSLAGGVWEHVTDPYKSGGFLKDYVHDAPFAVWHVTYRGESADDFHPLYWRSPQGNICYPQVTEGWYWSPEIVATIQHARGDLRIKEGWIFRPATDEKPFGFIPDLFDRRQRLERNRRGQGWPLKLALNSLYGKLAQQVGGKDGKPPRWHQLEWAGWITSKCRATMYEIAAPRRDNVICIQTDGLTIRGRPDGEIAAREGGSLGDLELSQYDSGVFVQSGIYWLHDQDGWHDPKVRGVGPGVLDRVTFEDMWSRGDFGPVSVEVTRFRGLVTSAVSRDRWADWCQWVTETRDIMAAPDGKRVHLSHQCRTCVDGLAGLHETLPTGGGGKSALHKLAFERKLGRTTTDEWWLDTLDIEDTSDE